MSSFSTSNKRNSIEKLQDTEANLGIENDENININNSRKSSNFANIKDGSSFISQQGSENNKKSRIEAQYLKDFGKYIQKKYSDKKKHSENDVIEFVQCKESDQEKHHTPQPHNRQERIQNELKRKLKLYSKSKEAKFNEIFDVFKSLDTFIDIKPFLHDLNTVNNTKMYNTIQELKQRIAEKKSQQEVDVMLEQVKEKIQKQEKEQEEEDKILKRGMKEFVQKQQLLQDSSKYVMNWRKNHKIHDGIMSEQLVDYLSLKNNSYQDLIDSNDPDVDAHQFYDRLGKQLFKQKPTFKKIDFSSLNTRRASIILRQEKLDQQKGDQDTYQIDQTEKRKRIKSEEEEITEEEKLKRAQESLKLKLLTLDGFEKENQTFADQEYFQTYQQKAQLIRKNLQKATESVFKHKWANANMKLKKLREDEYNNIMKTIKQTKDINCQNLQFPSKQSFQNVFQGKVIESQVAKIYKSPQNSKKQQQNNEHSKRHQLRKLNSPQGSPVYQKLNSYSASRSDSNYSKESHHHLSHKRMNQDQQTLEYMASLEKEEIDNDSQDSDDSDEGEERYFSKKWYQMQRVNKLSRGLSSTTNDQKIPSSKFNQSNRAINEISMQNKSQFHNTMNSPPQTQSGINVNSTQTKSFLTHRKLSHNLLTPSSSSVQHINVYNNNNINKTISSKSNQLTHQYFFPSNVKNSQADIHKKSNQTSKANKQPNFFTARNNSDVHKSYYVNNTNEQNTENHSKYTPKSTRDEVLSQSSRAGIHPQKKFTFQRSIQNTSQRHDNRYTESDYTNDQQDNISSVGCHNPPCTPSIRLIKQTGKELNKKQTENYQAIEKHLFNIKFNKFLKGIEHNQIKFGVSKEKYENKINLIQIRFENEITKYETPKLDIYQTISLQIFQHYLINNNFYLIQQKETRINLNLTRKAR